MFIVLHSFIATAGRARLWRSPQSVGRAIQADNKEAWETSLSVVRMGDKTWRYRDVLVFNKYGLFWVLCGSRQLSLWEGFVRWSFPWREFCLIPDQSSWLGGRLRDSLLQWPEVSQISGDRGVWAFSGLRRCQSKPVCYLWFLSKRRERWTSVWLPLQTFANFFLFLEWSPREFIYFPWKCLLKFCFLLYMCCFIPKLLKLLY